MSRMKDYFRTPEHRRQCAKCEAKYGGVVANHWDSCAICNPALRDQMRESQDLKRQEAIQEQALKDRTRFERPTSTGAVYSYDGRETRAVVTPRPGSIAAEYDIVGRGKARCSPYDEYDVTIGQEIAAARALADVARQIEELAIARAVPKAYVEIAAGSVMYGLHNDRWVKIADVIGPVRVFGR